MNRPARRNGSENAKMNQKRAGDAVALEKMPELGLRKRTECNVTKSLGSFEVPAPTSIKPVYKYCKQCLDTQQSRRLACGETKYTMERARIRSLKYQSWAKANLIGTAGYDDYAAACDEANPEKTPAKPRRQLEDIEEKTLNHGMFALILSCLLSNIFPEVSRSKN